MGLVVENIARKGPSELAKWNDELKRGACKAGLAPRSEKLVLVSLGIYVL